MTSPYVDVDLTVSSKERFVAYANNIFTQVQYSSDRTTPIGFDEYNESSLPTANTIEGQMLIKNARLTVSHDRIGDGLPFNVLVPDPSVTERHVDYHRTSAQELIALYGNEGKLEISDAVTDMAGIVSFINDAYETNFTEDDFITNFTSQAATQYLQIDPQSVLYKGVLAVNYVNVG